MGRQREAMARRGLGRFSLMVIWCAWAAGCAHNVALRSPRAFEPAPPEARPGERGASAPVDRWERHVPLLASMGDNLSEVPAAQRVVIYNAGFRIVVQSMEASLKSMESIAASAGGYVQEIKGFSITIRVPVQKYRGAIEQVEALGQVAERQLQAQDVTEEFVDLEARLKNAQNVRKRLEGLLEKADTVEATLEVEKELNRVNEEIERLTAKLELIRNRVAFSTITAQFERVARQTELIKGFRQLPFHWLRELDPNRLWATN